MNFDTWLKFYNNANSLNAKITLLSYLENNNVLNIKSIKPQDIKESNSYNIIQSIIKRKNVIKPLY